ncbi:MAG TPA: methylmalonyl Co-A mutase-associated GTPase MeaB [Acidobacteriota bacterium]
MKRLAELEQRVRSGDRGALARAITLLERGSPEGAKLLRSLSAAAGQATVVGLTGPPGCGKSTLVAGLCIEAQAAGARIAVLAVDPSSPLSGGALLGDRVRLQDQSGLFFRSLASRGARGGLAGVVFSACELLAAAGFEWILVETVGAGQAEIDVTELADCTVVVLCPGLGDEVQASKAGLLELADLFVVNKSDRPEAEAEAAQLEEVAEWAGRRGAARPAVLMTCARTGAGVRELWQALQAQRHSAGADGAENRRRSQARRRLERALRERWQAQIANRLDRPEAEPVIEALAAGRLALPAAVERLEREEWARSAAAKSEADGGVGLDHVAIASAELEPVLELLARLFGLEAGPAEQLEAMGVRAVYLQAGGAKIEVVAPAAAANPLQRFLEQRGTALHHLCLAVPDLERTLERLDARGVRLIDRRPRIGAGGAKIAFVHPSATEGVLVELKERRR